MSLFTRNALGEIYIPGSSIKGAIRNCIIAVKILENKDDFEEIKEKFLEYLKNKKKGISNIAKEVEKKVFSTPENLNPHIGIAVTDTYIEKNRPTGIYADIDYKAKKGSFKQIPKQREYLLKGAKLKCALKIDKRTAERLEINSAQQVQEMIEKANKYLFEKSIPFSEMIKESKNTQNTKLLPNGYEKCLVLGSNTGFYQKTILSYLIGDDYGVLRDAVAGKTLRLPGGLSLIEADGKKVLCGFVRMQFREI